MYNVIKKDGTIEPYNEQKIIDACNKAARRAMYELSDNDYAQILNDVLAKIDESYDEDTDIEIYDINSKEYTDCVHQLIQIQMILIVN